MAEHYVLCVLSTINAMNARENTYTLISKSTKPLQFTGLQTNEVPVKCLIELARKNSNPITGIICLASKQCDVPVVEDEAGELVSARTHFERSIVRYYERRGTGRGNNPALNDGFFMYVDYDGKNPSKALHGVIEILDRGDALVDIDTTGGPRDAAFLLTTVVQFIEAKYESLTLVDRNEAAIGMGTSVYVNNQTREIYRQNETFALNDLIHAISAFTQYGKAKSLVEYFERPTTGNPTSKEMNRLCDAMQTFADNLSLCRTRDINDNVNEIHAALRDFQTATDEKMEKRQAIEELIGMVREAEADTPLDDLKSDVALKLSLDAPSKPAAPVDPRWAKLANFKQQSSPLDGCNTKEELIAFLDKRSASYEIRRGEILFRTLVDNLESGIPAYVSPDGPDGKLAAQTIAIIRWCVDRDMLQQALALYKERVPECLVQEGLLVWGEYPPSSREAWGNTRFNPGDRDQLNELIVDRIRQLSHRSKTNYLDVLDRDRLQQLERALTSRDAKKRQDYPLARYNGFDIGQVLCAAFPGIAAKDSLVSINDGEHLSAALVWFYIISAIRNDVIHVHEEDSTRLPDYLSVTRSFFADTAPIDCRYDDSPQSLRDALTLALTAAEGKATIRVKPQIMHVASEWARADGVSL